MRNSMQTFAPIREILYSHPALKHEILCKMSQRIAKSPAAIWGANGRSEANIWPSSAARNRTFVPDSAGLNETPLPACENADPSTRSLREMQRQEQPQVLRLVRHGGLAQDDIRYMSLRMAEFRCGLCCPTHSQEARMDGARGISSNIDRSEHRSLHVEPRRILSVNGRGDAASKLRLRPLI